MAREFHVSIVFAPTSGLRVAGTSQTGGRRQGRVPPLAKLDFLERRRSRIYKGCRPVPPTPEVFIMGPEGVELERGAKIHPPKRRNSMVSRVHVHQVSASVWRAAMSNVASRTYKKKAWNELVGPALQRPAKSQKGASKATLRNGETEWCRGLTCTNFRPPFGGLRGQTRGFTCTNFRPPF